MPTPLFEMHPLLGIAARALLLLVITLGVAFACRRRSAAVVHGIWTIGLGGCLAIPLLTWLSPDWTLAVLPPQTPAAAPTTSMLPTRNVAINNSPQPRPPTVESLAESARAAPAAGPPAPQQTPASAKSPFDWPGPATWLFAVWAAGSLAVLLRLLQQIVAMRRCVNQSSTIEDPAWLDLRDRAAQRLGLRAVVALKPSPDAISPMVAGLIRPVVLLPADADRWLHERRKLVLLHELAHVQRRDVLTQTLAALTCAAYWFNPLAWWGASQMKRLREIACDDTVVNHSSAPATYAQTLLDIAKEYRCRRLNCAVAMARTTSVESRIEAILDSARNRAKLTKRTAFVISAGALIIAALVGTCQLASRAAEPTETEPKEPDAKEKTAPRTMSVRVLDDQSQPLSGANVLVSIWPIGDGDRDDFPTRDYTTDNEGRVDVAMPQQLKIIRLWPSKQGFVPQFLNFAEGTHEDGRLIPVEYEFRLQKGHRLSGRVVDVDGKPVADVRVQVKAEVSEPIWGANPDPMISTWLAEGDAAAITDADGRWEITNAPAPREPTDYQFRLLITHPEYAGDDNWGELQEQQAVTTASLRDGSATITLSAGIAIQGTITGPDGKPVTKGLVIWNDRPYWATGVNETQIDASGRYETKHLSPGKYPITVLAPGFAPQRKMIEVNQNLDDVDIQLEPGNPIRIKIVDQSGNPILKAGVGIGQWRGTEAIYNEKHPDVPDSRIPRGVDRDGIYKWDWAPADGVEYRIGAQGYAEKNITLVAKPEPHLVQLAPEIRIHGRVVDASSGNPIGRFRAIPVKEFRPDFYSTDFQTNSVAEGKEGQFELQIQTHGATGNRYRARIQAEGYRTALGKKTLALGDPPLQEDFRLEPAPPSVGEALDAAGKPADDFTVAVGTPTSSPHFSIDRPDSSFGQSLRVRGTNQFELAATFEPQRIRVFNSTGFAEVLRQPAEPIGTLRLQPWAVVSGRLMQGDTPIGNEGVYFQPLVRRGLTEARFQDSFYTKTDPNGHFRFDQLPPISGNLRALLGPWKDSPLTSSQSVPLALKPGDHQQISLGGEGATISGRVIATGRSNDTLSKQWSLNYLVSRHQGVDYPAEAQPLSFDPSGPLQPAWLQQPDFQSWVATRVNHFVKLSDDGRLRIHGVNPGEYDLVIQLYEQPSGCLVETIGEKVVPITIGADQVTAGEVNIGDIEVHCRIGPRVGADMRAFEFTDVSGKVRNVNDMSGRYVLFHAWATWCAPCLESMPAVKSTVEKYSDKPLTVVGLNIDKDPSAARKMADGQAWHWAHNYLGDDSDLMRQLAVSSVPAYYLVGPDGKLLASANDWHEIEKLLAAELK